MLKRLLIGLVTILCLSIDGLAADPMETAIGQRLNEMFTAGFGRGTDAAAESRRLYSQARTESRNDPRVEYAYGLVLLKQLKTRDAMSHFQVAAKAPGSESWPARQALTWCQFVSREDSEGFKSLSDFAKSLAASKVESAERNTYVEWIGQVVAALQKSADTVKKRELVAREEEALKALLSADDLPHFEKGAADVHTLYVMLDNDAQETREATEAKQKVERVEKQAQVAEQLVDSAEKRENLKKTAEEWKKQLDDQVAEYNKQLTRLERDYDVLQQRVTAMTALMIQLNAELAATENQLNNQKKNRNSTTQSQVNAIEQKRNVLGAQKTRCQFESDQTMVALAGVSQRAQAVLNQKAASIQQYELATGKLAQKDAALDKFQSRLKKDGEKLKSPPKGTPTPVASKINQLRSFRTYVEFDLVQQRDRLLATFDVAIPDTTKLDGQ